MDGVVDLFKLETAKTNKQTEVSNSADAEVAATLPLIALISQEPPKRTTNLQQHKKPALPPPLIE